MIHSKLLDNKSEKNNLISSENLYKGACVKIKKITFYFLGAILQIDKYCQTALGNIKIAVVRPLLCFATALILLIISNYSASQEQIAINVLFRVGIFNLFLGLFF